MAGTNRDEFREKTKLLLAKQAGGHCSDPSCRRPTFGSNADGDGEINLGMACHICAAAPQGPRYDPEMTSEQRRSASNGLWMCRLHGTAIDARDSTFTIELLHQWKAEAQQGSWRSVLYYNVSNSLITRPRAQGDLSSGLRAAAAADLNVFRRSSTWPAIAIELTLEVDGLSNPVSTTAMARALTTLGDLVLVAPPGMGKTTTLFRVAEAALASGSASAIVIPLGDWSADGASLLESVLRRPAFRGISEDDLRAVASRPGVVLLLDGWNELDAAARRRAAVQVERLQLELPELGLLISTRRQALDVPVDGARVDLRPLDESQQLDLAKALRGDGGARIVDQAWRTPGVRELVSIPLYLSALLALPDGAPFPTTKEEVLRRFVAAHEEDNRRTEALTDVLQGFHQQYLDDLAITATRTASTTIVEAVARRSVSITGDALVAEGQISKPEPRAVLEALVSHHVLMRAGDTAGYSFQHQQFQEWYASHFVERLMREAIVDEAAGETLKVSILNWPAWTEAILFACERLARGDGTQQDACGAAILAAFEIDPILASQMIQRSTDAVWARVGATIKALVCRWHAPGRVDRALRFMMSSGRAEFIDWVWPLITHENNQVRLQALRAGTRFQPSLLGDSPAGKLASLPAAIRRDVLGEIAFNSGIEGLDLAMVVAKEDPNPEVKEAVVDAFAFRRADRHLAELLRDADDGIFDMVARRDLVDDVADEAVRQRLEAARDRQRQGGLTVYDRLRAIVYARGDDDRSQEVAAIVAEMEINREQDAATHLVHQLHCRYPHAIAEGLLERVRAGDSLFHGAADLLAAAGLRLEDEALLDIALANSGRRDIRADAASSVLGPLAVGHMIAALLDAKVHVRDADNRYDQAAAERYHGLQDRIAHVPGASLVAAVWARSAQAGVEEVADLADLLARHPQGENDLGRPFDPDALAAIIVLAEDWANRMLASREATRLHLASIASLVAQVPSVQLLPMLKRLLDEELRRYGGFKKQAVATNWRLDDVTNEARSSYIHAYQRAFQAIDVPETAELMRDYLADEHFAVAAAQVLALRWATANGLEDGKRLFGGVDFSHVGEMRSARVADPAAISVEAAIIIDAIEPLIGGSATPETTKRAVELGGVVARLPHGGQTAVICTLLSVAGRRARATFLQNLVLSGYRIEIEMVKKGLGEVLDAAKTQNWILLEGYEITEWLRLLPFTDKLLEAIDVLRALPDDQRTPRRLEEMIVNFGLAPDVDAENALFALADTFPDLYANHAWQEAALRRGTLAAARRLVDLAAGNLFNGKGDDWHMSRRLAGLLVEQPELRAHVYYLLKDGAASPGLALLARAVSEKPDAQGLLALVRIEIAHGQSFFSLRTVQKVVTKDVPSESWRGTYNIVPASAVDVRRELLAMTTKGGPTDAAARWLNAIDLIRDDHGMPEGEPRHPDLASGKAWPIMSPDSDASAAG